jgi:hypothetical protein
VVLTITADDDRIGYATIPGGAVTWFSGPGVMTPAATYTINSTDFELVAQAYNTSDILLATYESDNGITNTGLSLTSDSNVASHFAFFVNPIPEPSCLILFGTGLVGLAGAVHRKLRSKS